MATMYCNKHGLHYGEVTPEAVIQVHLGVEPKLIKSKMVDDMLQKIWWSDKEGHVTNLLTLKQ